MCAMSARSRIRSRSEKHPHRNGALLPSLRTRVLSPAAEEERESLRKNGGKRLRSVTGPLSLFSQK
jgi:hypothetical protein